jgi:hypothetical protein
MDKSIFSTNGEKSMFSNHGDKSIFSNVGKDLLSTQKLELSLDQ